MWVAVSVLQEVLCVMNDGERLFSIKPRALDELRTPRLVRFLMLHKISEQAESSRGKGANCQGVMIGQEQAYRFIQLA